MSGTNNKNYNTYNAKLTIFTFLYYFKRISDISLQNSQTTDSRN